MNRAHRYESLIVEAQDELIQRLKALRYEGSQPNGAGAIIGIQCRKEGKTYTTFLWGPGETLGAALARVDEQSASGGRATKKGEGVGA